MGVESGRSPRRRSRPRAQVRPTTEGRESADQRLGRATAPLISLQTKVGNHAVSSLIASTQRVPTVQLDRKAGWDKADTRGAVGGWNVKERDVGSIRRVPLDGLTLGNTTTDFVGDESKKTTETASHRAIVLIPSTVVPGQQVDVMVHFHGFTHRSQDPYAGWRQHSQSGTVRDVDLDRIEGQLEASGQKSMIAVLPQGVGGSTFGGLKLDTYLPQIFSRLAEAKEPPGSTSDKPLTQGRLLLSGHSGGGDRIANMLGGSVGQKVAEIILFEAIHKGGLGIVLGWATDHLDRVASALQKTSDPTKRTQIVESCPKLYAYCSAFDKDIPGSGQYAGTYDKLKKGLDAWFSTNKPLLGTAFDDLRARFRVEFLKGASHETVVRGLEDDPKATPLTDALVSLDRPTAPSKLTRSGKTTWVHPRSQPQVGPAKTPTTPTTTPTGGSAPAKTGVSSPAKTGASVRPPAGVLPPERIAAIALAHGQGPIQLLRSLARIIQGGDGYRVLADVLAIGGVKDSIDLTDALFEVARPELGGSRIPADREDLKAEWRDLRKRYARPAVAGAGGPATGTTVATPTGTPTGPTSTDSTKGSAGGPAGQPVGSDVKVPIDPAKVESAKAATGAKKLSAEEQKAALEAALKQATSGGTAKARKDMEVVLENHDLDYDTWFGGLEFSATFLDVPIKPSGGTTPGVHKDLLGRLEIAEKLLAKQFPGLSKGQIAGKMNIKQIVGVRPPKAATGASQPSAHCFGLAIDINHATNPFVGNMAPDDPEKKKGKKATDDEKRKYQEYLTHRSPRVIERAMLLLHQEKFNIEAQISVPKGPDRAGQLWEIHHRASNTLAEYLRLADDLDGTKLSKLVTDLNASGKDSRDLATWKRLITEDRTLLVHWDFMYHDKPQKAGYMDLGKELVVALMDAGLLWGGEYPGAKDMMHFDWRGGTIKDRSTKPKKKAKS
jgi:hypothetical protein